jgi:hypothetical protein
MDVTRNNDGFCGHLTTMVTAVLVVKEFQKQTFRKFTTGQEFLLFQDFMKTGEAQANHFTRKG